MQNTLSLFIEINKFEYIFSVGSVDQNNLFNVEKKISFPLKGIEKNKIVDFEIVYKILSENIYLIEQKTNFTFKEVILILDDFKFSYINLTGHKRLNGSQLLKENITYILNTLKSNINECENNKKIIHIFNNKFNLDKKDINNIPIGLFGDFYTHELSFFLMHKNDYKNLSNIFEKCNLKIQKILIKSFIEGVSIEKKNEANTFFNIIVDKKNIKILYFENSALKIIEELKFGSDLIINDISKITSLNTEQIKKFLIRTELNYAQNEILEKEYFEETPFRKIKKKLILDIANARINELAEIILYKNLNIQKLVKINTPIFLDINVKNEGYLKILKESFNKFFSESGKFEIKNLDQISNEEILSNAYEIVHFGWKKEAVPIVKAKKTLISRFFDLLFN